MIKLLPIIFMIFFSPEVFADTTDRGSLQITGELNVKACELMMPSEWQELSIESDSRNEVSLVNCFTHNMHSSGLPFFKVELIFMPANLERDIMTRIPTFFAIIHGKDIIEDVSFRYRIVTYRFESAENFKLLSNFSVSYE